MLTVAGLGTSEKPVRDVRAYGASGDGETDDADAVQAVDAADDGDIVYFSAGNYQSSRTITKSGKSLSLIGDGMGVSEITFDTDDGGFDLDVPRLRDANGETTGEPAGNITVSSMSLITTEPGDGTAFETSWPMFELVGDYRRPAEPNRPGRTESS